MGVKGNREGLRDCNTLIKRTEPIVTPKILKERYLFGLDLIDPRTGEDIDDKILQQYIDNSVSMLEHYLDISIVPTYNQIEDRDLVSSLYQEWGYIQLNNSPVIQVNSIKLVPYRDNAEDPTTVIDFPLSWVRLDAISGIIRLIPNSRFPASLQIGSYGSFFPEVISNDLMPHGLRFDYDHGFDKGKIPILVNQAISMLAATQALIQLSNIVIAPGIAQTSLSIDGISRTIGTTASAENSAYSSMMLDYAKQLRGPFSGVGKDDDVGILNILKRYYKDPEMSFV